MIKELNDIINNLILMSLAWYIHLHGFEYNYLYVIIFWLKYVYSPCKYGSFEF